MTRRTVTVALEESEEKIFLTIPEIPAFSVIGWDSYLGKDRVWEIFPEILDTYFKFNHHQRVRIDPEDLESLRENFRANAVMTHYGGKTYWDGAFPLRIEVSY